MVISQFVKDYKNKMPDGKQSSLENTDPEFIEFFSNRKTKHK